MFVSAPPWIWNNSGVRVSTHGFNCIFSFAKTSTKILYLPVCRLSLKYERPWLTKCALNCKWYFIAGAGTSRDVLDLKLLRTWTVQSATETRSNKNNERVERISLRKYFLHWSLYDCENCFELLKRSKRPAVPARIRRGVIIIVQSIPDLRIAISISIRSEHKKSDAERLSKVFFYKKKSKKQFRFSTQCYPFVTFVTETR